MASVTGADCGIGRAVAVLFAREGADIAIRYLAEDLLRLVAPHRPRDADAGRAEQSSVRELEFRDQLLSLRLPSYGGPCKEGRVARSTDPVFQLENSPELLAVADRAVQEQRPGISRISRGARNSEVEDPIHGTVFHLLPLAHTAPTRGTLSNAALR
jgi:NAD(P)-dependent dehydrogenase (short-subunit alcohol dehydrogenase family)